MARFSLIASFVSLSISCVAAIPQGTGGGGGGGGFVPLIDKRYTWDNLPYKIDTDRGLIRGEQVGYNQCNSTTEGSTSLCQTAIFNSLDDFCFWAPPNPGHEVGEIEGEMVAWCTQPGHGTRIIPDGTITGVQFTKAPDYVQVVGFMNQTQINMLRGDAGGEMDPHGADRRGNPMGGILFTNAWTGSYIQVVEWHNFMGNDHFCLKACDPSKADDDKYCEHIFDTQGCAFNAPSNARDGVFESCASDNQPMPGQGAPIAPQSSQCSTYASTDIYGPSATVRVPIPGASTMSFSSIPRPTPTVASTSSSATASTSNSGTGAPQETAGNAALGLSTPQSFIVGVLAIIVGVQVLA